MERRIAKLTIYEALDADKVDNWISAGDTLVIDIERSFPVKDVPAGLVGVFPVQFAPDGTLYTEALRDTLNAATWIHAAGAVVFKISASALKEFTMADSFVWDSADITVKTAVSSGTVLTAEFTTPGLPESVKTVVSLPFGQALSSGDLTALDNVGLTLQAGALGSGFKVVGKSPFTVRFFQPGSAAQNYVIDFDKENQIIS